MMRAGDKWSDRSSPRAAIAAAGFAMCAVGALLAQERTSPRGSEVRAPEYTVAGVELAAAVNLQEKNVKAEGVIFKPTKVTRIRALLVAYAWGLGFDAYEDPEWQRYAEANGLVIVRPQIRQIAAPQGFIRQGPGRIDVAAEALTSLLNTFARESGHTEIAAAPLVLWGHSAGAPIVSGIAGLLAAKTIAIVRYHGAEGIPDLGAVKQIPCLVFDAGKDPNNRGGAEALWKRARAAGAPWTLFTEPDAQHGETEDQRKADAFLLQWLTAVFRARLPEGEGSLRELSVNSGWLGDRATRRSVPPSTFAGAEAEANWFPDEATAHAWQATIR